MHFRSQAKILWNRIPLEVRNDEPELDKVWRVGQALFERDPPKVHEAIKKQEWCQSTKSLIDRLQGTYLPGQTFHIEPIFRHLTIQKTNVS